jgi:UMF1 family MFS transporter
VTSIPLFINSFSVLLQAFLFISLSALADYGRLRKYFLVLFASLGSTVSMGYFYFSGAWTIAWVTLVSGVCFGTSFVFYYAFLPGLTRYHPSRLAALDLAGGRETAEVVIKAEERVGNGISSRGMAYGYAAGVGMLVIMTLLVTTMGQTVASMQISCGLAGLWWMLFTYVTSVNLKARPGPTLPYGENYVTFSWKQIFGTLMSVRSLSQTFRYLLAWFFLSDSLTTLVTVSVLYGKAELGMRDAELALAALLTPLAAFVGIYFWLYVQRSLRLTTRQTLLCICSMYVLLPIYGMLGFILPFGLKQKWEVWLVSIYHGMLLGAVQSYSRVLYSELLPAGYESQFYGLYSITDKGSAWIGPMVTAILADYTHNLRWGFAFLVVSMSVPVWLIAGVQVERGKREAKVWAQKAVTINL